MSFSDSFVIDSISDFAIMVLLYSLTSTIPIAWGSSPIIDEELKFCSKALVTLICALSRSFDKDEISTWWSMHFCPLSCKASLNSSFPEEQINFSFSTSCSSEIRLALAASFFFALVRSGVIWNSCSFAAFVHVSDRRRLFRPLSNKIAWSFGSLLQTKVFPNVATGRTPRFKKHALTWRSFSSTSLGASLFKSCICW